MIATCQLYAPCRPSFFLVFNGHICELRNLDRTSSCPALQNGPMLGLETFSSVGEHLPSMLKSLGSIPALYLKKKGRKGEGDYKSQNGPVLP